MEFAEVRAVPARRRRAHDRLERHRAHRRAVREALRRGARADGHAAGRRQRLDPLRQRAAAEERARRRAGALLRVLGDHATTTRSGWSCSPTAIELALPPRKGTRHVLRVIREVLSLQPAGRGTDIAARARAPRPRDASAAASSSWSPTSSTRGCRRALRIAARRHDVIAVVLEDPREARAARRRPGRARGRRDRRALRRRHRDRARARRVRARGAAAARVDARPRCSARADVDAIVVGTDRPYTEALLRFFRMRERRQ